MTTTEPPPAALPSPSHPPHTAAKPADRRPLAIGSITAAGLLQLLLQLDPAWIPWLGFALLVIIIALAVMLLTDQASPASGDQPDSIDWLLRSALRDVHRHAILTISACVVISLAAAGILIFLLTKLDTLSQTAILVFLAADGLIGGLSYFFFQAYAKARADVSQTAMFAILVRKLETLSGENEQAREIFEKAVDRYLMDRGGRF